MTTDNTSHLLARLENGLRTDVVRLKELESELAETLQSARAVGGEHNPDAGWNDHWLELWNRAETSLQKTRSSLQTIQNLINSKSDDRLEKALQEWETIVVEDAVLVKNISDIRDAADQLTGSASKNWTLIAATLESHLDTIHAFGQALRVKLELLKEHSDEAVNELLNKFLTKKPFHSEEEDVEGEDAPEDYNLAAEDIKKERHKFLGLGDIAKAMLLWVDNPEERLTKKPPLRVD